MTDSSYIFPLSFAQERLWFLNQLDPEDPSFNITGIIQVEGALDVEALKRTLAAIIDRHEILRTTFAQVDGNPSQVIGHDIQPDFELIHKMPHEESEHLIREIAEEPFNLGQGPMIRVRLIQEAPDTHIFVLVMHHIISDGWSTDILIREIAELYPAYQQGEEKSLPELEFQYADFSEWQRDMESSGAYNSSLGYWKENLADLTPLDLIGDKAAPGKRGNDGQVLRIQLADAAVTQALQETAQANGASLFMVLNSAFNCLLYRFTGQRDFAVGTDVAGRNRAEIEDLIGFFVNQLVLRAQINPNQSLRDHLADVRQTALNAYQHQELPFQHLVREMNIDREQNRNPLYQIKLVLQNTPSKNLELPGLVLQPQHLETHTAAYDLAITIEQDADGLHAYVEFATDLYSAAYIRNLVDRFRDLLAAFPGQLDLPINRVTIGGSSDHGQARDEQAVDILDLIAEQVAENPEAVALEQNGETLNYRDTWQLANSLARQLRRLGVGPESKVAVCLPRTLKAPVALLAVLKAGACFVPIDPDAPEERQRTILEQSSPAVVISSESLAEDLPIGWTQLICLEDVETDQGEDVGNGLLHAEQAAYMIFTSGSTGTPKGVVVSREALSQFTRTSIEQYQLGAHDRVLQFASLSFDACLEEIFPSLAAGSSLVLRAEGKPGDAQTFLAQCTAESITVLDLPTAFWHQITMAMEEGYTELPPSLRIMIIGGEEALPGRLASWLDYAPETVTLFNTYGPTETTVVATAWKAEFDHEGRAPIGQALSHLQAVILDRDGQIQPDGVPGELAIAGEALARGYHNNPRGSAQRFVPHPRPQKPGQRLYRTGDLAVRHQGNLYFLGRTDQQVKIRGFRVELGEIETALHDQPGVNQAVVIADRDNSGQTRAVAYLVLEQTDSFGQNLDPQAALNDIRAGLKEQLPTYMVPALFIPLETMPLTVSGKINRRALPKPDGKLGNQEGDDQPRDAVEQGLATIWAEVLGLETVSRNSHFFDMGGHSLMGTQVIAQARGKFGIPLELATLFENPLLSELAQVIRERGGDEACEPSADPMSGHGEQGPAPLSFAQERLWFTQQTDPDSTAFNTAEIIHIRGNLNVAALVTALEQVVNRHHILRTTYGAGDQGLEQIVQDLESGSLLKKTVGKTQSKAQIRTRAEQLAHTPFDLEKDIPIRAELLRVDDMEYALILVIHHIATDGWSTGVLVNDLSAFYLAAKEGREPRLPPADLQYTDFSRRQRRYLEQGAAEKQLAYWRQQLTDAPFHTSFPSKNARPAMRSGKGATHFFQLENLDLAALQQLADQNGATLFMTLLSAYYVLLGRLSDQDDLVVGTDVANRNHAGTENLVGFFVNQLVLRGNLSGDPSFIELLKRTRATALEAYANQDLPFQNLVEAMKIPRDFSRAPMFQVKLLLQNTPAENLNFQDLELEVEPLSGDAAQFDLILSLEQKQDQQGRPQLGGAVEYDTDLYSQSDILNLLERFQYLLTDIIANPEKAVSTLQTMPGSDDLSQLSDAVGDLDTKNMENLLAQLSGI